MKKIIIIFVTMLLLLVLTSAIVIHEKRPCGWSWTTLWKRCEDISEQNQNVFDCEEEIKHYNKELRKKYRDEIVSMKSMYQDTLNMIRSYPEMSQMFDSVYQEWRRYGEPGIAMSGYLHDRFFKRKHLLFKKDSIHVYFIDRPVDDKRYDFWYLERDQKNKTISIRSIQTKSSRIDTTKVILKNPQVLQDSISKIK